MIIIQNIIQKLLWKVGISLEQSVKEKFVEMRYVLTLDSDTNLILGSALELIGAMAHILNKPFLNKKEDCVIEGHSLIQPRIGINLEASRKSIFTKIYSGIRWNRFIYQCNF